MKKLSIVLVFLVSLLFSSVHSEAAGSSQLIIINKETNTLAFYNAGKLVRTFSVATGKSRDLTPEGTFKIVNKIVNRPYYTLHIPGGDPRNPLGNRWMGLNARGTNGDTYGIHGNNNESSIGKYVSHGCVRMHNTEVRWLFDQVQLNTTVIITFSGSSFDAIARAHGFNVNSTNGWVLTSGTWYYYVNSTPKAGWLSYKGQWYYLDHNGAMETGWVGYKGEWYYMDKSGAMDTGWLSYGGKRYFLDPSGAMRTGWLLSANHWYFFMPSGEMRMGWTSVMNKWYYFDDYGVMKTGWLDAAGNKYYLSDKGDMAIGWLQIDGKWYYFGKDGVMAKNTTVDGYTLGGDGARI